MLEDFFPAALARTFDVGGWLHWPALLPAGVVHKSLSVELSVLPAGRYEPPDLVVTDTKLWRFSNISSEEEGAVACLFAYVRT